MGIQLQRYFDISQAPDKLTFKRQLVEFAHEMDFPIVGAELVVERPDGDPEYRYYIGNRPPDWAGVVDTKTVKVDPVMQRLRRHGLPFMYDQKFYVDAGAPELWEAAAPYGYRTGIAVALRLPGDMQLLLGLDRERPLPRSELKLHRLLADLQLLAVHCQEAAQRFATPLIAEAGVPMLTPRELEVLKWARDGKTAIETGMILGISEPTVKFHLKNCMNKLGTNTKISAYVRAMTLGLI